MGIFRLLAGDPYQSDYCRGAAMAHQANRCAKWQPGGPAARQFMSTV